MREVNPKDTSRAQAFELWIKSPMPMVTVIKTFSVGRLVRASRRSGMKMNMLMCWCIGRAASGIPEFYTVPIDGKLMTFDNLALNIIVRTKDGGIKFCDVPFSDDIRQFNADYLRITNRTRETGQMYSLADDYALIGTSALTHLEVDGIVNQYSGSFNNPFLVWGRYRRGFFSKRLPISMQFHHVQMDGKEVGMFLNNLQEEFNGIAKKI